MVSSVAAVVEARDGQCDGRGLDEPVRDDDPLQDRVREPGQRGRYRMGAGGRPRTRSFPLPSDCVTRASSGPLSVTVAPGSTAPDSLVTRPAIYPSWAAAEAENSANRSRMKALLLAVVLVSQGSRTVRDPISSVPSCRPDPVGRPCTTPATGSTAHARRSGSGRGGGTPPRPDPRPRPARAPRPVSEVAATVSPWPGIRTTGTSAESRSAGTRAASVTAVPRPTTPGASVALRPARRVQSEAGTR